jgi:hypothetical protein
MKIIIGRLIDSFLLLSVAAKTTAAQLFFTVTVDALT